MVDQSREARRRNSIDDVIDVYKRGVDRTLLMENLKKSPTERLQALQQLQRFAGELHRAENASMKRRG